ncbi:hypothetical protein F7725_026883 [Dissostichus mawsoni]|uniref:Uncharacterized protein n=1 Tax=Dissostichus mawsoni TaxID=36200 RepID=A0A7J5X9V6_DISMA|nr:hypothetical protein F7725_026883 [Dissostichus mawsoni]
MNKSQWVYDVGGGGDYIEAAISSLGISDEKLLQNLAQRLSKKIKDTTTVPWPPHIDHLEEGKRYELLLKLLTWLKQPERKTADISPATLSLASMITYHITGQRTTTAINMGVNVHGMTRSKDLVETLHKSGVSISYADTLLLYDHWALMDLEAQQPAHRRLQTASQPFYEKKPDEEPAVRLIKKEISAQLKQKCIELTNVHQYRCPPGSKSEPPARTRVDPPVNGTVLQRARCVIHALSRVDNNGTRPPPHEQQVPAYSGAQSCRHTPPNKSKPYYHTSYNEPPSKSVVYDIMHYEGSTTGGVRCILLWREVLIQQRLTNILEHEELSENIKENFNTLRNALTDTREALQAAHSNLEDDDGMKDLITRVYEKPGTDMGDFWISFMEMSDPLVQNIDACHARNGSEYLSSTYNMLMAYDNHDYGRWLPDYWAMLLR